jgi:hypothetical protein
MYQLLETKQKKVLCSMLAWKRWYMYLRIWDSGSESSPRGRKWIMESHLTIYFIYERLYLHSKIFPIKQAMLSESFDHETKLSGF